MKLILGLLCVAVAALQAKAEVSAFALDQEYQYDYSGRVATGIAEDVQQFSGFGTRGKLIIQNQGNYLYVKLNDVTIGRGNQRYDGDVREEFEYSYSTPEGQYAEIAENLQKPIRVTVENGLVQSFDASPDDAEWSINIKKAILSLFQTNFDGINRVRLDDDEDQVSENDNILDQYRGKYGGQYRRHYGNQYGRRYGNQYERHYGSQSQRSYGSQEEGRTQSYESQSGRYPKSQSREQMGDNSGSQWGYGNRGQLGDNYRGQLREYNNLPYDEEQDVFRVIEDGIGGECETVYEFVSQPHPRQRNARVLNVTKHRLYDKCLHRPQLLQSNVQGQRCTECEEQGNVPLKTLSRVEYQITGDRYHFTIHRISSTGLISLAPLTADGQTITSAVNQTLELEDSRPIQQPITLGQNVITFESLAYGFPQERRNPEEVDLNRAHYYNRHYDEEGYQGEYQQGRYYQHGRYQQYRNQQRRHQQYNNQPWYNQHYNQQRDNQQYDRQQSGYQQGYTQQSGSQQRYQQQAGNPQRYSQQRGSYWNANNAQNNIQQAQRLLDEIQQEKHNQKSGNQQGGRQQGRYQQRRYQQGRYQQEGSQQEQDRYQQEERQQQQYRQEERQQQQYRQEERQQQQYRQEERQQQQYQQRGYQQQGRYQQGRYQQRDNHEYLGRGSNNRIPENILELISVLTRFNYDDYVTLQNQNQKNQQNLYTLLQVLPYVGTNPAVLYIKNVVENQDQINEQSDILPEVFIQVPFYVREPSERLINEVRTLLKQERVQANRELYNAIVLAYGTLIFRGCVPSPTNPQPGYAPTYVHPNVCSQYVKELWEKIEQAHAQLPRSQQWYDQSRQYNAESQQYNAEQQQLTPQQTEALAQTLVYLSALINTKLPEIYQPLKQIIHGYYHPQVRQNALWGLAELLPERREEVTALLNPILQNYQEDYVTRIYAFAILLRTEPHPSYIHDLVDSLRYEPNRQVASYMYSTLVNLANSSNPCYEKIGKHIEHALQYAEPLEYQGIQYSRNKVFSYQNEKYNYGRTTQIEIIGSNNTVLPREVYLRQSVNLLGQNFDILELGLYSEGTDALTSGLFGPDGQYSPYDQSKSVFNILRRHTRSARNVERERDEINEKLNIRYRNNQPLKAQVYVKTYNQYVRNDYLDENNILDYLGQGSSILQAIARGEEVPVDIDSVVSLTDVLFEIPNDMGFPVTVDLKVPVVLQVSGGLKLKVEPGLSPESRNSRKPTSVQLESNINVNVDYKVQGYVGVTSVLQNTYGYGISTRGQVQIPVNGQVQYDPIHQKVKLNYVPAAENYNVLYYNSQPYTFIADRTQAVPLDEQYGVLPVRYLNAPVQRVVSYGQEHLGVGVTVFSKSDDQWNDQGAYQNLVKSFFKRSSSQDDYYYWVDRLYAGFTGLVDHAILNPTARPTETVVVVEQHDSHPTTEVEVVVDYDYSASSQNQEFSEENPIYIPRVNIEKESYTVQIQVVGKGDSERRHLAEYKVSYNYQEDETIRKTVLNYHRSPLPNYDSQEYQFNYRGGAKYPSLRQIYYGDLKQDPKVEYNAVLNFGQKGGNDRQVVLTATVERSDEQRQQIRQQIEQFPYYAQCQQDLQRSNGRLGFSRVCKRLRYHLARLDSLTLDLEYKGVPDSVKNLTHHVSSYLRHYFYDNVQVNALVENPEHRIRIEANASLERPVVDFRVYTPHENIHYNNIYIPALIPLYEPYSASDNLMETYYRKVMGRTQPFCTLSGSEVRTFDNVTYNALLSNCYHVVAQDQSQDGQYTVLLRRMNQQSHEKALKVYFGNRKIEIVPEAGHLVVRLDGEVQNINDGETQVFKDPEDNQRPVYYIVNKYNKYFIVSQVYGVEIKYDGSNVKLLISKYYRGNQGGICGNYDGESRHEYEGPKGCQYHDAQAFVNSYAVPDSSCQVPQYPKQCDDESSPECIMKVNRNIYRGKGEGSRRICFSTIPLSECRPGCKPTALVRRRAGYHCLKAQDEYTKYLLRESRSRELNEIRTKTEDFTEEVQVPVACVPY